MTRLLPVLPFLVALIAGPAAALVGAPPRVGQPLLVLLAPGTDADAVLAAAGTRPVGPLRAPLAVLAAGGDALLPARLRAAGALFVSDGSPAVLLCGL